MTTRFETLRWWLNYAIMLGLAIFIGYKIVQDLRQANDDRLRWLNSHPEVQIK